MVWIHGDGAIGSGDQFDPTRLAVDGDAVVITFNFRLGVFGGFALPGLKNSGTIGPQDQRAVLQWVQRNVAAFGGDPSNVTLFGVSYGATATSAHLMSEQSRGLFHKVIMQSGFTLMDMPAGVTYPGIPALPWYGWTTTKDAQTQGQLVAQQLGCKDLACLKKIPVPKLLAVPQVMNIFQPYALGNDQLPADPRQALAAGNFADVPVLSGTTRDEHTTFVAFFRELAGSPVTAANYPALIKTAFGNKAAKIAAEYPLSDYPTPARAWAGGGHRPDVGAGPARAEQVAVSKEPVVVLRVRRPGRTARHPVPEGLRPGRLARGRRRLPVPRRGRRAADAERPGCLVGLDDPVLVELRAPEQPERRRCARVAAVQYAGQRPVAGSGQDRAGRLRGRTPAALLAVARLTAVALECAVWLSC